MTWLLSFTLACTEATGPELGSPAPGGKADDPSSCVAGSAEIEATCDGAGVVPRALRLDTSGNAYVFGSYSGTGECFGSELDAYARQELFIARLGSDGEAAWFHTSRPSSRGCPVAATPPTIGPATMRLSRRVTSS